ncbi:MAG: hypothetical protein DRN61_00590 [Thaumarchaeota archaeon]|nr:MAG: hypothetical protein DRN61_00590 [Nitrososphaerota archaeon]
MPRAPQSFTVRDVIVEIVEVMEHRTFTGQREYLVAYRIRDGRFISPVAHFICRSEQEFRRRLNEVVDHYYTLKPMLRGR